VSSFVLVKRKYAGSVGVDVNVGGVLFEPD